MINVICIKRGLLVQALKKDLNKLVVYDGKIYGQNKIYKKNDKKALERIIKLLETIDARLK
jgi:hypothetical protein